MPTAPPLLKWAAGEEHFYEVTLSTESNNGVAPVPVVLTLNARLELRFLEEHGESRLVVALKDVELVDRRGKPYDEAGLLAKELELPFGAILARGIIREYRTPTEGTVNSMGFQRQILAALQLEEGTDAAALTEWDATGLAKVSYVPGAARNEWTWKKLGYESVTVTRNGPAADDRQQVVPTIEKAQGRLVLDERGVGEVVREEATKVKVADNAFFFAKTRLSLKRIPVAPEGPALPGWKELVEGTIGVAPGQGAPIKSMALTEQVKRGDLSLDDVLKILEDVRGKKELSEGDIKQQATAFRALVAMIRSDDRARKVVLDVIEKGDSSAPVLLDALGSSSSPFGITVLSQLSVDKTTDSATRTKAATALLRVQWPNQEALDAVSALAKEAVFREHGLLGLGSFARRFREAGERGLNEAAVKRLEVELQAELGKKNPAPVAFLAVANSGENRFFELVAPFQKHPRKEVRDAAFQALRLMNDKRVEPILARALESESAADLRAALQAFRPRSTSNKGIVERVAKLALEHQEGLVRREAVLVIKKWTPDHPELAATLEKVRAKDQDKRVLAAAG